jgi:hypothetical protein
MAEGRLGHEGVSRNTAETGRVDWLA